MKIRKHLLPAIMLVIATVMLSGCGESVIDGPADVPMGTEWDQGLAIFDCSFTMLSLHGWEHEILAYSDESEHPFWLNVNT